MNNATRTALFGCACYIAAALPGQAAAQTCRPLTADWSTVPFTDLLPTLPELARDAPLFQRAERAVLTVGYDSTGVLSTLEINVAGRFRERDLDALRERIRETLPGAVRPHTRTRVLLTRGDSVRAEPYLVELFCPAEVRHHHDYWDDLNKVRTRRDLRPGEARLRLLVDSEGRVMDVKVTSTSGYTATDHALVQLLQRTQFIPARFNTMPVSVSFEWTMKLERPRRR
jgi:TonB family protein